MAKKKLTYEKLASVIDVIDKQAVKNKAKYALIGGAAFMLQCGRLYYKTGDIDIAASKDFPSGSLPLDLERIGLFGSAAEWRINGHFVVDGVSIDWIHRISDGTFRLFELAYKHRRRFWCFDRYVWVAPFKYSVAIRAAAGRPKDKKLIRRFIKEKRIEVGELYRILKRSAPKSKGYRWMKKSIDKLVALQFKSRCS